MSSLKNSFKYAVNGVRNTILSEDERNLRIQIVVMFCVIIASLIVGLSLTEWIIIIMLIGIVIGSEMINSAIETTLDYANKNNEFGKDIENAKDASAGGVPVLAIASAVAGLIIFIPKI